MPGRVRSSVKKPPEAPFLFHNKRGAPPVEMRTRRGAANARLAFALALSILALIDQPTANGAVLAVGSKSRACDCAR